MLCTPVIHMSTGCFDFVTYAGVSPSRLTCLTCRKAEEVWRQVRSLLPAEESAHAYELKQVVEQTFRSAYPAPNIGQTYAASGRLEKELT